ncbi:FHA domain-containing protein [Actinomadura livida]|nr:MULTISPECIES: FHA domain-containing protein [Actinomadura]MBB4771802.1 pSer/pThr/pTyr-binding forkhead associated (FHA) protein [Actinomadura catellatispora]
MTPATVFSDDRAYPVAPGETLTFGRSKECTICLDPGDTTISRRAGKISYESGGWWLANLSSGNLAVVDEVGLRSVLAPKRRVALETVTRVIVSGAGNRSHALRVEVPTTTGAATESLVPDGDPTAIGDEVLIRPADRDALLALFSGYLEDPPRYKPYPRTYEAAAALLGWPRTKLTKRIEYLRTRLDKAGVPNMMGHIALTNLAEYVLARRLITKDDLHAWRHYRR